MAIKLHVLLPTLGMVAAGVATAQTSLFFDDFESDTVGLNKTNFQNWDVTNGTVDLISGGNPGFFVDLDGSSGDAGDFATKATFNFDAGVVYTLAFDYASTGGNNSAVVTIGSQTFNISSGSGAFASFNQPFSFASATSAKLLFQDQGNDNVGLGIDNVSITSPVPEPASMLALGLGAIALIRRRKKA